VNASPDGHYPNAVHSYITIAILIRSQCRIHRYPYAIPSVAPRHHTSILSLPIYVPYRTPTQHAYVTYTSLIHHTYALNDSLCTSYTVSLLRHIHYLSYIFYFRTFFTII